jgi:SpoVK/Ycf46/Vps4 family AAA+-type ATPase
MWMVGVIDELLMRTADYKGPLVFATNRAEIVDPALKDRCFAVLQVNRPTFAERLRLWKQKLPSRFPLKLSPVQLEEIAQYDLSGRQIETVIKREASLAIKQERKPTLASLQKCAILFTK